MKNNSAGPALQLSRSLNRFDAMMLVIGNMIGIGIFTTTGYIAGYIQSPFFLFLIWILGGLYAFLGALTYAELSTRFPLAGGDFHYLNAAYHPLLGFLFGWSAFTVTYTGSIATIAVGFASYFLNLLPPEWREFQMAIPVLPFSLNAGKIIAILITVVFTWINTLGIRKGASVQNVFTSAGIAIILFFIIWGLRSDSGNEQNFLPFFSGAFDLENLSLIGVALIGVIFTYSGWTTVVYIAGEIREPRKNLPVALALSVCLVIVLYLLMNTIYLYALPLRDMVDVIDIGYQSLRILIGSEVGYIFSILIMLAALSTLNSTVLSGARIYFAMAREGRFFKTAGKLHPKNKVPANSLRLQGIWSVLLILSGSFNQLLTYTVFVIVIFAFLSGLSLFVLRKKQGVGNSMYPVWGYPVVPGIYLLISAWIMLNTLYHRPWESLIGIGIVLLGIPFYFWWRNSGKTSPGY